MDGALIDVMAAVGSGPSRLTCAVVVVVAIAGAVTIWSTGVEAVWIIIAANWGQAMVPHPVVLASAMGVTIDNRAVTVKTWIVVAWI